VEGRRGDQRGVHQRAFAQQQTPRGEVGVDGGEQAFAEGMRFKQEPKVQQDGGIRHAFGGQINPRKTLEGVAVVARVFERLVGEAISEAKPNGIADAVMMRNQVWFG